MRHPHAVLLRQGLGIHRPAVALKALAGRKTSEVGPSEVVEKGERQRSGMVLVLWREAERRNEAIEEWADVGGLLATGSHGDVQAGCCQGHIWVLDLLQPGPVWMTVTFIATKGHKGAQ